MLSRKPDSTRRPTVFVFLFGVILVPLLAVSVLTGVRVGQLGRRVQAAETLRAEVEEASAWVEARAAIQTERFYTQGVAIATELGIPLAAVRSLTGLDMEAVAERAALLTDAALEDVSSDRLDALRPQLETVRASGAPSSEIDRVFDGLEVEAMTQIRSRGERLRRSELLRDGSVALQSAAEVLWELERFGTLGREQMAYYFTAVTSSEPRDQADQRRRLIELDSSISDIVTRLQVTHARWAEALLDIQKGPAGAAFDEAVESYIAQPGTGFDIDRLAELAGTFENGSARERELRAVYADAEREVTAIAEEVIAEARGDRLAWLLSGLALLVASTAMAILVAYRISRPLRRLEGVARLISEGQLGEVGDVSTGPREVVTVGTALHEVAVNLRSVADQARALADGNLADSAGRVTAPGPLGEAIDAALTQLLESMRAQEAMRARLAHEAKHDSLTGLPNRAGLLGALDAALSGVGRGRLALLFIDLDGFKAVNDLFGHATGDELLRQVAGRLRERAESGDVVGRLGGDEFILVRRIASSDGDVGEHAGQDALVLACAEEIVADLTGHYHLGDETITLGASVGITFADASVPSDVVLAEADIAVYRAKALGRGRVEIFDSSMREAMERTRSLEADLARALRQSDQLSLVFQPIVDLETQEVCRLEALLRWHHPTLGDIPPGQFIPIAERSPLIVGVGERVVDMAVDQLEAWQHDAQMRGTPLAINASARELLNSRYVDHWKRAIDRTGIDPSLVMVEITETSMLEDSDTAAAQLGALAELGIRVAVDDFGTGYASFAHLALLPVHAIKIDRSFVAGLGDERQTAFVRLLIEAGQALGLEIVAEGVEEVEQAERLAALGCHLGQGYLIARPAPAAVAAEFCRSHRPTALAR